MEKICKACEYTGPGITGPVKRSISETMYLDM